MGLEFSQGRMPMIEIQPLNETALARETLRRIGDPQSVLNRAGHVLELVADSRGLGEVLQDYAVQGCAQIRDIVRAASHAGLGGAGHPEDKEALRNIHYTLKTVRSVLEMIPAAMQRNKLAVLGGKERLLRADIAGITHAFLHSPDIIRLLAAENSGDALALVTDAEAMAPAGPQMLIAASH
jgi:hypothetical protein